jgi:hydroxyacylglutathione hydrolase
MIKIRPEDPRDIDAIRETERLAFADVPISHQTEHLRCSMSLITALKLGGVNAYLFAAGDQFVLVDSGPSARRAALERSLRAVGCTPGKLKLLVLTHGDGDHSGNCAFLQSKYGAKIAIHALDAGMVENGDMAWNRKGKADQRSLLFKAFGLLGRIVDLQRGFERFTPDILVDEGFSLACFGLGAHVLHLPGHSKGSIGLLTDDGSLFCGDLAYNMPGFKFVDDAAARARSLEKLTHYAIRTVYPGHGKPFPASVLFKK